VGKKISSSAGELGPIYADCHGVERFLLVEQLQDPEKIPLINCSSAWNARLSGGGLDTPSTVIEARSQNNLLTRNQACPSTHSSALFFFFLMVAKVHLMMDFVKHPIFSKRSRIISKWCV